MVGRWAEVALDQELHVLSPFARAPVLGHSVNAVDPQGNFSPGSLQHAPSRLGVVVVSEWLLLGSGLGSLRYILRRSQDSAVQTLSLESAKDVRHSIARPAIVEFHFDATELFFDLRTQRTWALLSRRFPDGDT